MKKNLTELVFILDRSGSMAGLEKDTIGGFNSMIARQKAAEGEALVSTVLFSNESKVIHDRIDVRRVEPLTERQYIACGCTALLDAIGGAIHHISIKFLFSGSLCPAFLLDGCTSYFQSSFLGDHGIVSFCKDPAQEYPIAEMPHSVGRKAYY